PPSASWPGFFQLSKRRTSIRSRPCDMSRLFSVATSNQLTYRIGMKREPARPGTEAQPKQTLRRRFSGGFSLIELLATALIIMVLFTMYWGGNSGQRQRSRQALCRQNLQKLYIGAQIFANEHAGKFPDQAVAKTSGEALDVHVPIYA